jgi:hypothetical protein
MSKAERTFSCLKKHSIFSSRKTLFDETRDWNTFGNFFRATLLPSRGSVTALQQNCQIKNVIVPRANLQENMRYVS